MNTDARPLYARHENSESGRLGRMDNSRYSFHWRMGKSDGSRCDGRFVTCIFAHDTLSTFGETDRRPTNGMRRKRGLFADSRV